MAQLSYKLGDKVVLASGPYSGCVGYIVLIADDFDAYLITVRLSVGPTQKDLVVRQAEIRRAE
jgi:hypothetical protein